jgi:hypothetical protein
LIVSFLDVKVTQRRVTGKMWSGAAIRAASWWSVMQWLREVGKRPVVYLLQPLLFWLDG